MPFYDIMRTNKTTNKTKGKRMKKLLNISVIAALAILPVAANADITTTDPGATNANAPVAANAPKYSLATADGTDANLATAGYVKGAYNATIKAINKVATTANSAVQSVTEGATNGTVSVDGTDVAVHGLGSAAYTDSTAYATAAQGTKADNAETNIGTMANLTGGETTLVEAIEAVRTTADGALTASDITAGSANGTIAVDGQNVAVTGLGSAAYTDSTAYATAAQGTKADNAETLLGNSAMGTTATTVTGAIAELKNASGDYATKAGVLATINASTVPVMAEWGSTTATTVSVDAPASFVNQ